MHRDRKSEQLRICLEENVESSGVTTGFERYRFIHNALPELDLADVDTSVAVLGRQLKAPILISPMTGGTEEATAINRRLAAVAQRLGLAMGVGSQRAAIVEPSLAATYQVRDVAPDVLLFANLGAVQFNRGFGPPEAQAAVDMIAADALMLHINPLHEALQPNGDTTFAGLTARIADVCAELKAPVVVKEVGYGLSAGVAARLKRAGVAGVDVAGAGGTSWGLIESIRARGECPHAEAFASWGIPTAESVLAARAIDPDWLVVASGGIRTGVDVAKAIALGADIAGIATPLLRAAVQSEEALLAHLRCVIDALRIAMFAAGARSLADLRSVGIVET